MQNLQARSFLILQALLFSLDSVTKVRLNLKQFFKNILIHSTNNLDARFCFCLFFVYFFVRCALDVSQSHPLRCHKY